MTILLAFYLTFMFVAMALPTFRVWRATGVNPLTLPKDDSAAGFVGRMFKLLIATLGLYLVTGALGLHQGFGSIAQLHHPWLKMAGWTLLGASVFWVVIAQFQMGQSWRVGIDDNVKTELVSRGLFKISRNPIFLGMIVQIAGLFFVLPDAITLTILVTAFMLISVQVRFEEEFLAKQHGEAYTAFAKSVRRWI